MTQEALAKRCGLSADTIRRVEAGMFSPSLQTLRKFAFGLGLNLGTIFEAFELGETRREQEIVDLLASRSAHDLNRALRVLIVFFDAIDAKAHGESDDDDEPIDDAPPDEEPE